MTNLFHDTINQLIPELRAGRLDACKEAVVEKLQRLPPSPFHISIDVNVSNDPADIATTFDRFLEREASRINVAATYAELNGFDINPSLWFCDFFAYIAYGGHQDYDWLADWQSTSFPRYVIHGMEPLQTVYAQQFRNASFSDAESMSSLLVVIKFQQFLKRAAHEMKLLHFPLLATAHDFDFIAELGPTA